jgi:hypothetical protein
VVREAPGADDPVEAPVRRLLRQDPHPRAAVEQDVVSPVGQRLGLDDLPGAGDRVHRRTPLVVLLPPGAQHDDAQPAISGQAIHDHLPIARLEHVERQDGLRKEHHLGQREDRDVKLVHRSRVYAGTTRPGRSLRSAGPCIS